LNSREDWRIWAPRPEIAPRSSRNAQTEELVLEGGGNPAVFGRWQRPYGGIRGGQWHRSQVRHQATGLGFEPLQAPVRLDWTAANGERAGQPDYAWQVIEGGGWRLVSLETPENAASVKVQLLLQNSPKAAVRYKDVSLTPVAAPSPRTVRIATVRLRPKGPDPVSALVALVEAQVPEKTDIILLPEGITIAGTDKKYVDVTEPVPGAATYRLGELARRKGSWVVAGVYEREGRTVHNTAVLIDRSGKLVGKYRKLYILREELEGGITPGFEFPVFDTDVGKVEMIIC
jgi:hypothetical protein